PSHDGSMLAWYAVRRGRIVIRIAHATSLEPIAILSGVRFDTFRWHPFKDRLLVFAEKRLFEVDPSVPNRENWADVTPRGFENWRIESLPKQPDERMIVATADDNPAAMDLYTVRPDGSDPQLLERNDG